jgi:hypothetical protein
LGVEEHKAIGGGDGGLRAVGSGCDLVDAEEVLGFEVCFGVGLEMEDVEAAVEIAYPEVVVGGCGEGGNVRVCEGGRGGFDGRLEGLVAENLEGRGGE